MHTFTDFSDGALFGPKVRSSLVEMHTTGLHRSFPQKRARVDMMHLSSVGFSLLQRLGVAELASGRDPFSLRR